MRVGEMLRGSVRQVRKAPGFAAIVVLMVALGVGVNVTVFALVDGVLLTPLPYPRPERIVSVSEDNPNIQISVGWTSIPNFLDWRERSTSFDAMALFRGRSASVETEGDPEYAYGAFVSEGFFDVFGVQPALGRGFTAEETRTGGPRVVVLSHGLWVRGYGGDQQIVGRTVSVDGRPHTVIGVMPAGFNGPGEWIGAGIQLSLWRALAMDAGDERENRSYSAVARLSDGATLTAARDEVEAIHSRLREAYPDGNGEWRSQILEWEDLVVGGARAPLLILLGTMVLVLVIACANVAGLTTTRILARRIEMATRVALGAHRGAIVSQVLAELSLLVGLGGVSGVLGAQFALAAVKAGLSGLIPRLEVAQLDGTVLLFALLATAVAGLLAGAVATVLSTRHDPARGLGEVRSGVSVLGWRIRGGLTVVQIVASFALLSGAALLARSFQNMNSSDLGFEVEGLTALTVALSWDRISTPEERTAFTREMLRELESIPGVQSAAMINSLPLSGSRQVQRVTIDGITEQGREPAMAIRGVSAGYHSTMEIPLIEGRLMEDADMEGASTALLSENAARLYWPDRSPLGDRVRVSDSGPWLTVVGVVGNVLHSGAGRDMIPELYIPYPLETLTSKSFVVRTAGPADALPASLRSALRGVDAKQPVREVRSMLDWVGVVLAPARFQAMLMVTAALIATILAGVGLFAAIGSLVRERGREIAIRMTLGARKGEVLRLVIGKALTLVVPGMAGGLVLALMLGGVLKGLLFGVEPHSPVLLMSVAAGLLLIASAATGLPAARAASVDPARVLREE